MVLVLSLILFFFQIVGAYLRSKVVSDTDIEAMASSLSGGRGILGLVDELRGEILEISAAPVGPSIEKGAG